MKKLSVLLVAFLLVAGLAFAGGEQEGAATADIELSEPGTYPIVQTPISFDLITIFNTVETSGTPEDAELTAFMEELTNIRVNWVEVIESNNADEKLNLILASGDLPDAFSTPWHFSKQEVYTNGINGTFIDLTEIIQERAVNLWTELQKYPWVDDQVRFPGDRYYAMPRIEAGCYHCTMSAKFWVYEPWLDALGLEVPETTEEFRAMLEAFRDGDPNGNGIADEIPMAGATTGWNGDPIHFLMNSFIYTDTANYLTRDGGTVEFVANKPEWRQGLQYLNGLYEDGLIAQETYVQQADQMKALVENPNTPIVGSFPAGWYGVYSVNGGGTGRFADLIPISPVEGPNGFRAARYSPPAAGFQVSITPEAQYPEAIVQMFDYFYSGYEAQALANNFNQKGVHYREATQEEIDSGVVSRDGSPAEFITLQTGTYGEDKKDRGWTRIAPGWQIIARGGMPLEWADDPSRQEYRLMHATKELMEPYKVDAWMPPNLLVADELQDELTDLTQTLIGAENDGLVGIYTAEFITGSRDINDNAEWEAYVRELERAGVDRYVEIWNDTLQRAGY